MWLWCIELKTSDKGWLWKVGYANVSGYYLPGRWRECWQICVTAWRRPLTSWRALALCGASPGSAYRPTTSLHRYTLPVLTHHDPKSASTSGPKNTYIWMWLFRGICNKKTHWIGLHCFCRRSDSCFRSVSVFVTRHCILNMCISHKIKGYIQRQKQCFTAYSTKLCWRKNILEISHLHKYRTGSIKIFWENIYRSSFWNTS